MDFADIILPVPLETTFTYSIPESYRQSARPGMRVFVPFGRGGQRVGIIRRIHPERPTFETKPIIGFPDHDPIVTETQLELWQWIADYYLAPIGDIMTAALPALLKGEAEQPARLEACLSISPSISTRHDLAIVFASLRRSPRKTAILRTFLRIAGIGEEADRGEGSAPLPPQAVVVTRDQLRNEARCEISMISTLTKEGILVQTLERITELEREAPIATPPRLSPAQTDAYNAILMGFLKRNVVLLHGVTASGKTEIYIHLIAKTIAEGRQALYLLPEIALTVQITRRLSRIFGSRLAIYHSKCTDAERREIWTRQLSDHPYDVVLGARSAVFLPFKRLGLVILDEEHDPSYKQAETSPRYHARSLAIVMASKVGAKILLGTATPSIESYTNARKGKYGLVRLTTRYQDVSLPKIHIIDTADLRRRKIMKGIFSPTLLAAVRKALDDGRQAIIFHNRRGFTPMIECRLCGWTPRCTHCDVPLTYHKSLNRLTCHYCGTAYPVPHQCPNCESEDIRGRGAGTEKIEDEIAEAFPGIPIARMDLDTTRSRHAYEHIIEDFSAGRTRLLIGTQMVTKGLDFDKVSVVGILNADTLLNMPDFRAHEQAFMMLSQVSGRAGRKGEEGHVYLQTRQPELPVLRHVVSGDYEQLYEDIITEREAFAYPPFCRLVYVYVRHTREPLADMGALMLSAMLRQSFGTRVLGPDKPPIARVKSQFIRKLILKIEMGFPQRNLRETLYAIRDTTLKDKRLASLKIYFDIDPL